ncbi:hypothetical protein [Haloarcula salinisoli]|uniref:Uncharacterized protein n=1 Tax=Haloarcula salinisoli TaxID=2487746 RepID=A0A8J7YLH1_9EURY|nr:hypothetical protein [Halomicroarcula salinisoli]MBX0285154.1 hypothetical protein [Halomicroarcula salinisoli]MBX0303368.1 hypothetical protein [Halomicroarcula salinisoli]
MKSFPGVGVAFRLAPAVVVFAVAGAVAIVAVVENVVDWNVAISIVFIGGLSLAFALGAARNHREQLVVIGLLLALVVLFVAAGVQEATTSFLGEGIAMMLAIGFLPLAMLLSIPLYRAGDTYRGAPADRSHRLLLTAASIPWMGGAFGYFFLQQYLRATRSLYSPKDLFIRSLFDIWPTVLILIIGAGFVYGVHRMTGADPT